LLKESSISTLTERSLCGNMTASFRFYAAGQKDVTPSWIRASCRACLPVSLQSGVVERPFAAVFGLLGGDEH
jgi:hypothetical protein